MITIDNHDVWYLILETPIAIASIVAALAGLRNHSAIADLHIQVDGRMSELLVMAKGEHMQANAELIAAALKARAVLVADAKAHDSTPKMIIATAEDKAREVLQTAAETSAVVSTKSSV